MKTYEILEHTADIGIRVKARDLSGLFKAAGLALFQLSAEKQPTKDKEKHKLVINQKANSLEELFINWLNELLSLSAVEAMVFEDLQISKIDEHNIEAVALGSDMKNYKINSEIKAATYHALKIEKNNSGWIAEVIFDV